MIKRLRSIFSKDSHTMLKAKKGFSVRKVAIYANASYVVYYKKKFLCRKFNYDDVKQYLVQEG